MTNETNDTQAERRPARVIYRTSASAPMYGLGFLGAAVYYVQHATTIWMALLGILKAAIWPAMVLYRVLEMLKM